MADPNGAVLLVALVTSGYTLVVRILPSKLKVNASSHHPLDL